MGGRWVEKWNPCCIPYWKFSGFICKKCSILKRAHGIHPSFTCAVDETSINPCSHSVYLQHGTLHKLQFAHHLAMQEYVPPMRWESRRFQVLTTMLLSSRMWNVMLHQVSDCWHFKGLQCLHFERSSSPRRTASLHGLHDAWQLSTIILPNVRNYLAVNSASCFRLESSDEKMITNGQSKRYGRKWPWNTLGTADDWSFLPNRNQIHHQYSADMNQHLSV